MLPKSIDAMVLTHAHLDHSGYPLYTARDAKDSLASFQFHEFSKRFEVAEGCSASLSRAGHILGASSALLEADGIRVLFSGDLGRKNDPILKDPDSPPAADYVLIESTYGNRSHPSDSAIDRLAEIIRAAVERKGVVLIPAFAVGRAQLLLFYVHKLKSEGRIPDVPAYLNSPMAINVTELFCENRAEHTLSPEDCHQVCGTAKYVRSAEESKALNEKSGPMIIISANGMISGGRILHHVTEFGPKDSTTIILPGYHAVGTRGRSLAHGAKFLRMLGADVAIRAKVETLDGLSAHADASELLEWLGKVPSLPKRVFITHGEPESARALKQGIERELGFECEIPRMHQEVELK